MPSGCHARPYACPFCLGRDSFTAPEAAAQEGGERRRRARRTSTGGLKNLPIVAPANELVSQALRGTLRAKVSTGSSHSQDGVVGMDPRLTRRGGMQIDEEKVKNPRLRAKKLGALR